MALFYALRDKLHEFYVVTFNAAGRNFVIKYQDKQATLSFGKAPNKFVEDCRKICADLDVDKALIMGSFKGRMKLYFSHQIKKTDHQKFKNSWHLYK
jgi:hypothetical protein